MSTETIKAIHDEFVMPTYAPSVALVKGEGSYVWDAEGNRYLDFLAGIAVTNIGHANPRYLKAIREQSEKLVHVSNLYFNEQQPRLAQALVEKAELGGGKVFFCNSGAEANEGLIKLARRWGSEQGKFEIVTMNKSFHGRTLATLTATGQDKVKTGFSPLPAGFKYADFNDLESVASQINENTAAVLVEALQGEGGVLPADPDFITGLRALCDAKGILLMFDEVQCGVGRTGKWFGFQNYNVIPDAFSLAKGLGNGFPMGAIVAAPSVQDVLQPGSHATTFGGTPLACAAGMAVIEEISENNLCENAFMMGLALVEGLCDIAMRNKKWIAEIRGTGLMLGVELDVPAARLQAELQKNGLLGLATAGNVMRFLPPLNITFEQVQEALEIIAKSCDAIYDEMAAISPNPCQCGREG